LFLIPKDLYLATGSNNKKMEKPQPFEYTQSPYVSRYINQLGETPVLETLTAQLEKVQLLFSGLGEEKSGYRYAEGKWSLKELLGHMVDTERIMAYRALCIARGEKQPLPGFDENAYAEAAGYSQRPLADLLQEHRLVREGNMLLFKSLTKTMLDQIGNANGAGLSARAIIHIIAGHEKHHLGIIRERYLS
jgi:hypothetical protein